VETAAERDVLQRAVDWANDDEGVRALILESSRAVPDTALDEFSDYDLLVVVSDIDAFATDDGWLAWWRTPLVRFSQDRRTADGRRWLTRLVVYDDGTKVDHQIWPVDMFRSATAGETLPAILDVGYRVLVDKDAIAADLPPPTFRAHIPTPPTEAEFLALVEEFWWESTYVAKNLARGELFPWKYSFEAVMKFDLLRRMLEWRIEIDHGWSVRPGAVGRHLRERLDADTWREVEPTFTGADVDANWDALFRTGDLFRRVAKEVAAALGYAYPQHMDDGVVAYWRRVRGS
jgi:aminoglycoside 6-adenylyltransferase